MRMGNTVFINNSATEDSEKDRGAVNPVGLRSGIDKRSILSEEMSLLMVDYRAILSANTPKLNEYRVKVSEVLSTLAFTYEKIRNAVDYKGEHLLRRSAIERILKRQIWENAGSSPEEISVTIVKELIWARYLDNNTLPASKIAILGEIISKYLALFRFIEVDTNLTAKQKLARREWFLQVAACELEDEISPITAYWESLSRSVFFWFKQNYDWQGSNLSEDDKDVQIYIASLRCIAKVDRAGLKYSLFKIFYPGWTKVKVNTLEHVLTPVFAIMEEINRHLKSPVEQRLFRYLQKQSAAFIILKEIIDEDIENSRSVFENPQILVKKLRKVCQKKYSEIRKKINTGIRRSIIYIIATKLIFALLIEIPYEVYFLQGINYTALATNLLIPPFLMLLIGLSIRKPTDENTKRIIERIRSFVYGKGVPDKIPFSLNPKRRNDILSQLFLVVYGWIFFFVFGSIAFILLDFGFNLVSIGVFYVFLSLVMLFSFRVRYTAGELNVTGERESFLSHLFTNLTLPFLNLGVWLSKGLSKLNFLLVIMDFLIEAPFKKIMSVFEEWTGFIRERREEVVEVPN